MEQYDWRDKQRKIEDCSCQIESIAHHVENEFCDQWIERLTIKMLL